MVLFGAAALAALLAPAASLQALRDDPTRVSAASFIQLFRLFSSAVVLGDSPFSLALGPAWPDPARVPSARSVRYIVPSST